MNQVNKTFTRAFEGCQKEIPFDSKWSNGSGDFDYAVYGEHAPRLTNGEMVRSKTSGGRRVLLVGTRLGNLVVYDRFADQAPGGKGANKAMFTLSCTSAMNTGGWFSDIVLDEYEMCLAVGDETMENMGRRLETLHVALRRATEANQTQSAAKTVATN